MFKNLSNIIAGNIYALDQREMEFSQTLLVFFWNVYTTDEFEQVVVLEVI